jgi:hypothetical protein
MNSQRIELPSLWILQYDVFHATLSVAVYNTDDICNFIELNGQKAWSRPEQAGSLEVDRKGLHYWDNPFLTSPFSGIPCTLNTEFLWQTHHKFWEKELYSDWYWWRIFRNILRIFNIRSPSAPQTLKKTKLHGLSPQANYTDRATAAYRRS